MIGNYFKTALRSLRRQKVTSLINIFCLAIAVGCSIVAYLFVDNNINREWSHANASNIFLVEHQAKENDDLVTYGTSPTPLGPAMTADLPQVVRAVRIAATAGEVRSGDQKFHEAIRFVDPGFLDMFTFPFKYGDRSALAEKNAVVISEGLSKKYFGEENPVGRTLVIKLHGYERSFTIRAVTTPIPGQSCVEFSLFMPYENRFYNKPEQANDWKNFTQATFIQTDKPENIDKIASSMDRYIRIQDAADTAQAPVKAFQFENLLELKSNAGAVKNSIAGRSVSLAPIIVLSSIAIFLLLLASFNFINISMAMAGTRLKEIGIRKVIGGNKVQLITQFLTENVVILLISFLLAIVLADSFLLPAFNNIAGTGLIMDFSTRLNLWTYLLILLAVVGLISGMYPALYISSFQPISILRDRIKFSSKSGFMQFLLGFQFVLAFITMMVSVGLTLNAIHLQNRDWGYDKENILVVRVENESQYNLIRKNAMEQPNVLRVTGSKHHVGDDRNQMNVKVNNVLTGAMVFEVGQHYFETMGFQMKAGKFPASRDAVVVNEAFAKSYGGDALIGQTIEEDSSTYSVAGIVKDFHHRSFQKEIEPLIFRLGDESTFSHVVLRTEAGTALSTMEVLKNTWKKFFPDLTFNHFFQDEVFEDMYQDTKGILQIFIFTTVLALLMSCVGLFGLATQRLQRKMKEVCIRKVFGVSVPKAIMLVNGNFLVLLAIAALVATPLTYFILNALLDSIYRYRMEVGPSAFIISYLLVFVTMFITLLGKIYEIAITNPAEILRNE